MNICAGLISHSHAWEQMLLQEGIPFQVLEAGEQIPGDHVSVLIVNRSVSREERIAIERYLRSGGGVIGCAQTLDGVAGVTSRPDRIEYIMPDRDGLLTGISLLDLGLMGDIPREANTLRTQDGSFACFAGDLSGGVAVVFPFDPEIALLDVRAMDKSFYARRERLPSERVSLVAKGEVRHLLHAALAYVHHRRGLPYLHLWYFPEGQRNQFVFRVDTDRSSKSDIDALYMSAREYGFGLTWFLDVRSHEPWLEHFAAMSGQEIGVHCYEHRTFESFEENYQNIGKARGAVEGLGVLPQGFAAPFGSWNVALAKAVDRLGFLYSSEFSLAYDTMPYYPPSRTDVHSALQIPIHPICPGSLTKVAYGEEDAAAYFAGKVAEKLARREPLFFYHHPGQHAWNTVRALFSAVRDQKVEGTTMAEFARWWQRRLATRFAARVDGNALSLEMVADVAMAGEQRLRILPAPGQEAIVPLSPKINLGNLQTDPVPVWSPPPDIRRIRDFDPRAVLGDLYTKMTRRFR